MRRAAATGLCLLLLAGVPAAGQDWVARSPLCPAGLVRDDEFGSAVAVGPEWIAIGAFRKNVVYLFRRGATGCAPVTTIPGPAADGWFGFDLAMDGNRLLVGAPRAERTGAAYLIELREEGPGIPRRIAVAGGPDDEIGSSVAIDGNVLAIGARGAGSRRGRVYVEAGGSLREVPAPPGLAERAELGQSVALSGSTLVMGAPFPYRGSNSPGAAYVVELGPDGSPHSPVPLRLPSELEAEAAFGYSVAMDAGRILVGAPLADRGGTDAGAVYRFERSETAWVLHDEPVRVGGEGDQLGVAVALDGTTAVAGARYAHGERSGAAYVLGLAGGSQELPPPMKAGAEFGFSVAIDDGMVVVGAFRENGGAGAAYRFEAAVQVGFESAASTVLESSPAAFLDVVVIRPSGGTSPVMFDLAICPPENGICTATPGTDFLESFLPPGPAYTIPAGETRLRIAVPIVSDNEGEGIETFTVQLLPRFPAVGRTPTLHRVTIDDNTYLVVTPGPLTTREDGTSATLEVRLSASPTAAVTVSFTSTNPTEGTVSPSQLTFAAGDQELTRTVQVRGEDDVLCDGPQPFEIAVQSVSEDPRFDGVVRSISGENGDDERTCSVAITKKVCTDDGSTVVYTLSLSDAVSQVPETPAQILDLLPPEVSVVMASADRGTATADAVANTVGWSGSLPPEGEEVTITIVAVLDVLEGEVSNRAAVTWDRDGRDHLESARSNEAVFQAGDVIPCPD